MAKKWIKPIVHSAVIPIAKMRAVNMLDNNVRNVNMDRLGVYSQVHWLDNNFARNNVSFMPITISSRADLKPPYIVKTPSLYMRWQPTESGLRRTRKRQERPWSPVLLEKKLVLSGDEAPYYHTVSGQTVGVPLNTNESHFTLEGLSPDVGSNNPDKMTWLDDNHTQGRRIVDWDALWETDIGKIRTQSRPLLIVKNGKLGDISKYGSHPSSQGYTTFETIPYSDIVHHFEYNPISRAIERHIFGQPAPNPYRFKVQHDIDRTHVLIDDIVNRLNTYTDGALVYPSVITQGKK